MEKPTKPTNVVNINKSCDEDKIKKDIKNELEPIIISMGIIQAITLVFILIIYKG